MPLVFKGKISRRKDFLKATNPDMFRLSLDISLGILLVRYQLLPGYGWFIGYYFFVWVYGVYHYIFWRIYHVPPALINDARMFVNGAAILWNEQRLKLILGAIAAVVGLTLLGYGLAEFLRWSEQVSPIGFTHWTSGGLGLLSALVVYVQGKYWYKKDNVFRVNFMLLRVMGNLRLSLGVWRSSKKRSPRSLKEAHSVKAELASKPNLYYLFIESYGSILLDHPELVEKYQARYQLFVERLEAAGWYVNTQQSTSSGFLVSWLAYTTTLMGTRLTTNYEYEAIMNDPAYYEVDTLSKFFQKQGYQSINMNPAKQIVGMHIPFKKMEALYGIDRWILREHIPYSGDVYGFTECPPDQYVLNYVFDQYLKDHEDPFVLFFLTKNSHSPFVSPLEVAEDWRALEHHKGDLSGDRFLKEPTVAAYWESIEYQLGYLEDFIIRQGRDSDIFLLLGDHQPHAITDQKIHRMETLFHIVSRNKDFVEGFSEYGLDRSLESLGDPVRHEAIYSMFLREIIRHYGTPNSEMPTYEPHGA